MKFDDLINAFANPVVSRVTQPLVDAQQGFKEEVEQVKTAAIAYGSINLALNAAIAVSSVVMAYCAVQSLRKQKGRKHARTSK